MTDAEVTKLERKVLRLENKLYTECIRVAVLRRAIDAAMFDGMNVWAFELLAAAIDQADAMGYDG